MAWVANPFAYIAINTLVAVLPGPLTRLRFSLTKDDPAFRRAVCLAVACALAGLIPSLLGLGRPLFRRTLVNSS